ncbi:lecithin-cholesterol acyltransferase-like 4 [Physcomitrium patens]|uniref:Uncharacterized protein n=1 Tax=Physcomitrium patens TaxID=3218 RepID=A0A2K1INB0_PHYPA|nr:lecithin-cholesterol acyltransferase-like 4 [Physcomitrium patens]PNR30766.1 hypothetical protein PHYPA_027082 [Physcomitrium patens]|eukprot:XP_024360541.1 lecithin-cholesterol acyltransferase-like 4 [Physcomitrella patens]
MRYFKVVVEEITETIEHLWPWHHKGDDGQRDGDKERKLNSNPVLLVPGIGGSILNAVDQNGRKERVWVRLFEADYEFRSKLFSFYDPVTGKTHSLDKNITIEVPEDRFGLYSCDILDPDVVLRIDSVYYFHDLIEQLKNWGYEEGKTLFGFGYDFRQSNRLGETMDRLKAKLEMMYEVSGGKKVDIITHSMGGIVLKSFLALHPEVFERYVNSWIAVTAPFQGAPGFIMDCLLTGVEFVKGWQRELFVAKWSMHQLLIECPSVYELIASPHFEWSEPPELRLWRKKAEENGDENVLLETFGPKHNLDVMIAALKDNKLDYKSAKIPLPLNEDILKWALETQRILQTAKLPESVKFYNLYGTSFETPYHACYGSKKSPLQRLTEILDMEAEFSCVDGDGTVPVESAMADGLNAEARVGIPGDHRSILRDQHFFHIMKHWLKVGGADPEYDPETDYVIVPRSGFEFDSHMEESIAVVDREGTEESLSIPPNTVYIATVETGSGSSSDTRAEAHAHVHPKAGQVDESEFQVSTIGVAEGVDEEETKAALDQVMVAASKEAKARTVDKKRIVHDDTCVLTH